jgi:hypothetical protein
LLSGLENEVFDLSDVYLLPKADKFNVFSYHFYDTLILCIKGSFKSVMIQLSRVAGVVTIKKSDSLATFSLSKIQVIPKCVT